MPQGLVVGVMSLGPAFSLGLRCSLSLWFTPSNSQAPAARKLPVFLRDFPHLLRVCIFSSSHSPPPASASMSLSHTHSYPGLISFFFFVFFISHTLVYSLLLGFLAFLTHLVLLLPASFGLPFSRVLVFTLPIILSLDFSFKYVWSCEWACEFCLRLRVCLSLL